MGYFLIFIIIATVIVAINNATGKEKKLEELKSQYDDSLKRGDKRAALEAGRAYYSALRKNQALTIYDEQAIANDLAAMN